MSLGIPSPPDLAQRKAIARALLAADSAGAEAIVLAVPGVLPSAVRAAPLKPFAWPAGLAPRPTPPAGAPDPDAALPPARVLIITWTAAEHDALAAVFTRGVPRSRWFPYRHHFADHYQPIIRPGAPSIAVHRLGSWYPLSVGTTSVIAFKSELHLNQDGIKTGDGTATMPVRDLFRQLIEEVKPEVVLTVGTSGAVFESHQIGDVVVTRAALFRLQDEFANEPCNATTYRSDWVIPRTHLGQAHALMQTIAPHLQEPAFGPPTTSYPFPGGLVQPPANQPDIKLDGDQMPEFHPILTTDYFEFGTSANHLEEHGCAVEMGDAVLGLVCSEMATPPHWAVVRNISDPQINAALPTGSGPLNMQTHWAVWFYEAFGYWTSVSGALAAWGIVAGIDAG